MIKNLVSNLFIINEDLYFFYNIISTNLKIYEKKNGSFFQLEDIINNNINNYSLL